MDKQIDKKIDQIEKLKEKELLKIEKINIVISGYDAQLKLLKDVKKEQEKIIQKQEELNHKIQEIVKGEKRLWLHITN